MIKVQELTKIYRSGDVATRALDAVSMEVNGGEFVTVTGPSGGGKSTLLNILGLLDRPTAGQYWLFGDEVSALDEGGLGRVRRRQRGIGFVFQDFQLIDDLSIEENVKIPLLYRGVVRAAREKLVRDSLERLGVAHRAKHYPSELSGGQQQRVAIARAIVAKPAIVLADEPTGNLDSANGDEVMTLLRELVAPDTSVVMVTHSYAHAGRADRVVRLIDGRIVESLAA
jgi:putative ABC transport system ATP-binding protein